MATRPNAFRQDARVRRWCWWAIVAAVLLGAYAGALGWATRTVDARVQASIQPLPVLMRDRPDRD